MVQVHFFSTAVRYYYAVQNTLLQKDQQQPLPPVMLNLTVFVAESREVLRYRTKQDTGLLVGCKVEWQHLHEEVHEPKLESPIILYIETQKINERHNRH